MNLKDWQLNEKISNSQLARLLEIHPSYVTHLKAGRRNWSPKLAEAVEILSEGKVNRLDLLYPHNIKKSAPHTTLLNKFTQFFLRRGRDRTTKD